MQSTPPTLRDRAIRVPKNPFSKILNKNWPCFKHNANEGL